MTLHRDSNRAGTRRSRVIAVIAGIAGIAGVAAGTLGAGVALVDGTVANPDEDALPVLVIGALSGALMSVVVVTVVTVVTVVAAAAVGRAGMRFASMGFGTLWGAARLLPGWAASRYLEEWRGELYDLRAQDARWWRRAGYVVGVVLYAAPVMAVALRLSRTKVVD